MLIQDGKVGSGYIVDPIPRKEEDWYCPHCGTIGDPSNRYLYRCSNPECGRYW